MIFPGRVPLCTLPGIFKDGAAHHLVVLRTTTCRCCYAAPRYSVPVDLIHTLK